VSEEEQRAAERRIRALLFAGLMRRGFRADKVADVRLDALAARAAAEVLSRDAPLADVDAAVDRLVDELAQQKGGRIERRDRAGEPPVLISGNDIELALGGLCPGFWPFC
jgi:hypothetical protein